MLRKPLCFCQLQLSPLNSLFKMPRNKIPGLDDFLVEFFMASWQVIGEDFTQTVLMFFNEHFMPSSLNVTSLVLLPKRPGTEEIQEFHPILCLNIRYKLIIRLLTARLKAILPDLILSHQTAFVKDRVLLDKCSAGFRGS